MVSSSICKIGHNFSHMLCCSDRDWPSLVWSFGQPCICALISETIALNWTPDANPKWMKTRVLGKGPNFYCPGQASGQWEENLQVSLVSRTYSITFCVPTHSQNPKYIYSPRIIDNLPRNECKTYKSTTLESLTSIWILDPLLSSPSCLKRAKRDKDVTYGDNWEWSFRIKLGIQA